MKKRLITLILALYLLAAAGCGGNSVLATDVSLNDIREEMISSMGEADPIRIGTDYLYVLYGIPAEDLAESASFMITRSVFADEVILTKAVDEAALGRIRELLEARLTAAQDQSRDYDPESFATVSKSKVETRGLYAWLIISFAQDELGEIFTSHLKNYAAENVPVYTPTPSPVPTATPEPVPATPVPAGTEAGSGDPAAEEAVPAGPAPYGLIAESVPADDAWFDDVIFIGNSVAKNLETYVTKQRMSSWPTCMGKAVFFTAGSYTYKNAADGSGNPPRLSGKKYSIEMAIEVTGAKKAFISLGQGDIVFFQRSIDETMGYVEKLIGKIRALTPETEIYFLGMTPRAAVFEDQYANSEMIRAFNEALCALATENDCYYINSFEALADENGCLPEEFCSETYDGGIHLTDAGCEKWLAYLYRHTA